MRLVVQIVLWANLALVAAVVVGWHLMSAELTTPLKESAEPKVIVVPASRDPVRILDVLEREGVASVSPAVRWALALLGRETSVQGGEFALAASMSVADQFAKLERGEVVTHTIVVPRGATTDEVLSILSQEQLGEREALESLVRDPSFAHELGVDAEGLDGYLYPDVYTLPRGLSPKEVLATLVRRFQAEVPAELFEHPRNLGYPPRLVVAVASVLERAKVPEAELGSFASLVYNRLAIQMPLGGGLNGLTGLPPDPAVESPKPTKKRKRRAEPRPDVQRRLTLHPLGNPGLPMLRAAANPSSLYVLYFVPRGDGSHVFCADRECFDAAVFKWAVREPVRPGTEGR